MFTAGNLVSRQADPQTVIQNTSCQHVANTLLLMTQPTKNNTMTKGNLLFQRNSGRVETLEEAISIVTEKFREPAVRANISKFLASEPCGDDSPVLEITMRVRKDARTAERLTLEMTTQVRATIGHIAFHGLTTEGDEPGSFSRDKELH